MRTLVLLFTLFLIGFNVEAQDSYLKPYLGYGIGLSGAQISDFESTQVGNTKRYDRIELARGVRAGLAYGYFFSDNMGIEVNFNYQNNLGQRENSGSTFIDFVDGVPVPLTASETLVFDLNSYSFSLAPLLHFQLTDQNLKPFMSIGPSVLLAGLNYTYKTNSTIGSDQKMVKEYDPAISVGVLGNAGLEIPLGQSIRISVAVQYQMGYYSPNRAKVLSFIFDGIEYLPSLAPAAKEIEFVDEVTDFNTIGNDPNAPSKQLKNRLDYSSINLVLGVIMPL